MMDNTGKHIPISYPTRPEVQAVRQVWARSELPVEGEELVEVSAATRRIAGAYERFRNTLEPEEIDILRRSAIVRMLERRLSQDRSEHAVALALIQELIRANYIKHAAKRLTLPVAQDIRRARFILDRLDDAYHDWFLALVAVSIDRRLHTHDRQETLTNLMYHDTYQRVTWMGNFVAEGERASQLFIACSRVLFGSDDNEITYSYFVSQFPVWEKPDATEAELSHLVVQLPAFFTTAEGMTDHPGRYRLLRALRPAAVPYRILYDVLQHGNGSPWVSQAALEAALQQAIGRRREAIRTRMNWRTWHSILFLFFTKTILTGVVEYPYELIVLGEVHTLALGINIVFHPLLLFFSAAFARLPGESNSDRIKDQAQRVITGQGELPTIILSSARHYGPLTWSGFAFLYTILFLIIFWSLFSMLDLLQFSLVAMFLFVVFLGLVVFLAFRVRRAVDEIRLEPAREGFIATLFSFIGLPILEFGRWLARNIRQLNLILFFMDRVLEAPFKLLIDVIEDWFSFVRDRKEEIV